MFNVFISYSTHDLTSVTELHQSLNGTGVEVFVAEHSVSPSERLTDKISSAIAACDLFILLWSANARASDWVPQEIGKAHSLNKTILPLVLDEGLDLPGFISGLKYLPVFRDRPAAMAQVQELVLNSFHAKHGRRSSKRARERAQFACSWGTSVLAVQSEVKSNFLRCTSWRNQRNS